MGGPPELPFGLSTMPGDLPVDDVDDAVALAFHGRDLPSVPVLPVPGRSLLAQVLPAVDGAAEATGGGVRLLARDIGVSPLVAASVDGPEMAALHASLAHWTGAVQARPTVQGLRIDMVGPVTLGLGLAEAGVPLAVALDAARVVCAERAEALLAAVRAAGVERTVVVVMCEPRLVGAMHPTFRLSVREVRSLLDPVVDALDRAERGDRLLIGIHVPGRSDWLTIISSGVSFLSMPPEAGLLGWAPAVAALLDNGGFVAWGAVPVDRPIGASEELLWRRLSAVWSDLVAAGVDAALLRQRCLISPADGLGRFGAAQIPGVVGVVDALAERVRSQAIGTRLTAGS
jgi:hypothetical protein